MVLFLAWLVYFLGIVAVFIIMVSFLMAVFHFYGKVSPTSESIFGQKYFRLHIIGFGQWSWWCIFRFWLFIVFMFYIISYLYLQYFFVAISIYVWCLCHCLYISSQCAVFYVYVTVRHWCTGLGPESYDRALRYRRGLISTTISCHWSGTTISLCCDNRDSD